MACERGLVTSAGIVAGGAAFDEAVEAARRHPWLSVGLHVTLSDGRSVLPSQAVPDLTDGEGRFRDTPFSAGVAYWRLRRSIAGQIAEEVKAQFDKVEGAGIHPTHVDCHHHLHVHPLLFDIIAKEAAGRGVSWIRVPSEPLALVLRLHGPRLDGRAFLTWCVFRLLAGRCLRAARRYGMRAVSRVYGLSGTGRIDESYLCDLLPYVRGGASEIYVHPDLASACGLAETEAVMSKRVGERLKAMGLDLIGFRELSDGPVCIRQEAEGAVKP